MSEYINNVTRRKEMLKRMLQQLHEGRSVEDLRSEFSALVREASSAEIAEVEQMLISEGTPPEAIQLLCDVHVAVFQEALEKGHQAEAAKDHPVFVFQQENQALLALLADLRQKIAGGGDAGGDWVLRLQEGIANLADFEHHYTRKENLLFPYLERVGFTGPSQVMWGIHDQIRTSLKQLRKAAEGLPASLEQVRQVFKEVAETMDSMVFKEEKILFPAAIERLTPEAWMAISEQDGEIARFRVRKEPPVTSTASAVSTSSQASPVPQTAAGELALHTGALTSEQIDLMLTRLPVDITFVDENDTVRYYSQTPERIFVRTPAIIGRSVQNCHPPASVHTVQRILDDFRAGRRDRAEFWIQMNDRFIDICYYALRDSTGAYRGTLEVSQDVTALRALHGERRLLDE